MKKTIYESYYQKLDALAGGIETLPEHLVLKSSGYMDLHIEKIREGVISMTHYYKVNGDLVPDPDMEVRVLSELKAIEALTYQDTYGFQQVYPKHADQHRDIRRHHGSVRLRRRCDRPRESGKHIRAAEPE